MRFHFRAYARDEVAQLEAMGWVRCTAAEAQEHWPSGLDELVAMKLPYVKRPSESDQK